MLQSTKLLLFYDRFSRQVSVRHKKNGDGLSSDLSEGRLISHDAQCSVGIFTAHVAQCFVDRLRLSRILQEVLQHMTSNVLWADVEHNYVLWGYLLHIVQCSVDMKYIF